MEWATRERIIHRICSGIARVKIEDNIFLIKSATLRTKVLADHVYEDAYLEALALEMMTERERLKLLKEKDIWDENKDLELRKLHDNIEGFKFRIFLNRFNTGRLQEEREGLKVLRNKINELEALKASLENVTCNGYAQAAKTQYLLEKTVKPLDNLDLLLQHTNKIVLTEKQLRFVARNEPWRSNYISNKQRAIGMKPSDWGIEQCSLMIWSRMYDNILNYDDRPESFVINDDDMLDGWLIYEKKEQKRDKRKRGGKQRNEGPGIQETFIFLDEKDDPQAVEQMNSPLERMIKDKKIYEASIGDMREVTKLDTAKEQMMMEKENG